MAKKTIIQKGLDFWFQDIKTIKIFKLGIIIVTVLIWILIPLSIFRLLYVAYTDKAALPLVLAIILTYSFFGILKALSNVNNMLKMMVSINDGNNSKKK